MSDVDKTNTSITDKSLGKAIDESAKVILKYQKPSGAYPASPNFKVYEYSWFRDGAFIADAMSRAGYVESAESFFKWCSDIVVKRRDHILSGGRLEARYTYDGKEADEDWETFQLDGYGTLLWAMKQHEARHGRSIEKYQEAAGLIQHYLATKWQEPSIDWWEERKGQHSASLACIYAGLEAYGHPEAAAVKEAIDLSRERTDASLLACAIFDAVSEESFKPVIEQIERELVSEDGGVFRYRQDTYYGGGEWPVLTSLLGWYYAKADKQKKAEDKLSWVLGQMQKNGWIPEQSQAMMLHPEDYHHWVMRWGKPADPLLWSQAMMMTLATLVKAKRSS